MIAIPLHAELTNTVQSGNAGATPHPVPRPGSGRRLAAISRTQCQRCRAPDALPEIRHRQVEDASARRTLLAVFVWGDRLFLTSSIPIPRNWSCFACFSAKTGAILWRAHRAPAPQIEETHVVSNPATASPAVDKGASTRTFLPMRHRLHHRGEPQWTAPLPDAQNASWQWSSPPRRRSVVSESRRDAGRISVGPHREYR